MGIGFVSGRKSRNHTPVNRPLKMGAYQLNPKRGLIAGLVGGALAFAVPWLLLYLIVFAKWLLYDTPAVDRQYDINFMSKGAWLGSYFLTSLVVSAACVAFGTNPRCSFGHDFAAIALVAIVLSSLVGFVDGPRLKSEPPFGEKPLDIVLLTAPAVVTGIVILAWRMLHGCRRRATIAEPAGKQP
jgi:hypothetical protein